eukprot:g26.t1
MSKDKQKGDDNKEVGNIEMFIYCNSLNESKKFETCREFAANFSGGGDDSEKEKLYSLCGMEIFEEDEIKREIEMKERNNYRDFNWIVNTVDVFLELNKSNRQKKRTQEIDGLRVKEIDGLRVTENGNKIQVSINSEMVSFDKNEITFEIESNVLEDLLPIFDKLNDWDEMSEGGQKAAETLGYNEKEWNKGGNLDSWKNLSAEKQNAYLELGFTRENIKPTVVLLFEDKDKFGEITSIKRLARKEVKVTIEKYKNVKKTGKLYIEETGYCKKMHFYSRLNQFLCQYECLSEVNNTIAAAKYAQEILEKPIVKKMIDRKMKEKKNVFHQIDILKDLGIADPLKVIHALRSSLKEEETLDEITSEKSFGMLLNARFQTLIDKKHKTDLRDYPYIKCTNEEAHIDDEKNVEEIDEDALLIPESATQQIPSGCGNCNLRLQFKFFPPKISLTTMPSPLRKARHDCTTCAKKYSNFFKGRQQSRYFEASCNPHTVGICLMLMRERVCHIEWSVSDYKISKRGYLGDMYSPTNSFRKREFTSRHNAAKAFCSRFEGLHILIQKDNIDSQIRCFDSTSADSAYVYALDMEEGCKIIAKKLDEEEKRRKDERKCLYDGVKDKNKELKICREVLQCPETMSTETMEEQIEKIKEKESFTFDSVKNKMETIINSTKGTKTPKDKVVEVKELLDEHKNQNENACRFIMSSLYSCEKNEWLMTAEGVFEDEKWSDKCFGFFKRKKHTSLNPKKVWATMKKRKKVRVNPLDVIPLSRVIKDKNPENRTILARSSRTLPSDDDDDLDDDDDDLDDFLNPYIKTIDTDTEKKGIFRYLAFLHGFGTYTEVSGYTFDATLNEKTVTPTPLKNSHGLTANQLIRITTIDATESYQIEQVASDGTLTLNRDYRGSTVTGTTVFGGLKDQDFKDQDECFLGNLNLRETLKKFKAASNEGDDSREVEVCPDEVQKALQGLKNQCPE